MPLDSPAAPAPRLIVAPRLDGGSSFRAATDPRRWIGDPDGPPPAAGSWAAVITDARRELSADDEKAIAAAGGRLTVIDVGGVSEVAVLRVSGMRRGIIRLAFADRCETTIDVERGTARIEFRAKLLWSGDWREGVTAWLDGLADALGFAGTVADGDACPWECTRAEVCADFLDLPITASDRPLVQTRSKISVYDTADDSDPIEREEDPEIETLAIGSRASACSIVIYDKTRQVNVHRRGANASNYAAAWQAGGWRGSIGSDGRLIGPPIRRVEVRLKDRALELIDKGEDRGSTASKWNLRTPARLMDPEALAAAWTWATGIVHRLVRLDCDRTGEEITRKHRAPMDDRWRAVHAAAAALAPIDPDRALKQSRRQSEDIHRERLRRSARKIVLGIEEFAAQHGMKAATLFGRAALIDYARSCVEADGAIDPVAWHERYLAEHCATQGPAIEDARLNLNRWIDGSKWGGDPRIRDDLTEVRVSLLRGSPEIVAAAANLAGPATRIPAREESQVAIFGAESVRPASPRASPRSKGRRRSTAGP